MSRFLALSPFYVFLAFPALFKKKKQKPNLGKIMKAIILV